MARRAQTAVPPAGYQGEDVQHLRNGQSYGFPNRVDDAVGWRKTLIDAYNVGLPAGEQIGAIPGFQPQDTFFLWRTENGIDVFVLQE